MKQPPVFPIFALGVILAGLVVYPYSIVPNWALKLVANSIKAQRVLFGS